MSTKKHDVPQELLTKLLVERALGAELTEHLDHEHHEAVANSAGNTRNGKSKKAFKGDFGELLIEVPRDRHGGFEPHSPSSTSPNTVHLTEHLS